MASVTGETNTFPSSRRPVRAASSEHAISSRTTRW